MLKLQSSTDLWFASFLRSKNFEIKTYDIISRGKGKFYFEMSDEDWRKYKLEFNNSDISKLKQIMDGLKDLCF